MARAWSGAGGMSDSRDNDVSFGARIGLIRRLFMRWIVLGAAFAGIAIAVVATPVSALPVVPNLSTAAGHAASDQPPILLVRDICDVRYEGNIKHTRYCEDPYVCDRATPGKCKPGPELQRKLDAELERMNEMQRNLDAQLRNLRRGARTTNFTRMGSGNGSNDRRAHDPRNIPSPDYGKARPPQDRPVYGAMPRRTAQVPPNSRPPSLRAKLTLALMVQALYKMAPEDPDRADQQNKIVARAKEFEGQGENIAPALKKIIEDEAKEADDREKDKRGPVPDTQPAPTEATPPPPPQEAAADPPKPYSDKDEALCSYLMTLTPDRRDDKARLSRLGQPVPAYCEPYLNSLPKPSAEATPPPFYLSEADKEEAHKEAEEFYRDRVLPPSDDK
jgi:hypothetical protein